METTALTKKDKEKRELLETKEIRPIMEPKKISENEQRQLMNHEI